jgi:intraflagellar transport protein 46
LNKPFDETLEFSQSGSDDSVDTLADNKNDKTKKSDVKNNNDTKPSSNNKPNTNTNTNANANKSQSQPKMKSKADDDDDDDDDEQEESYENIEGAYNPKDYQHLNVTGEVRDLFQYIERYKPHEVELDTALKCFIPEYIPAIGEMDGFIKVPRPDGTDDDLGLKVLDEPASVQSDPTVLELQLRAISKKLQYGDVVVRSIENANKNPNAIEKWIQNIDELHRSKPPPQVHYRRNMPEIESLMEVWPEDFERALESMQLPSPDLEMSLAEYVKVLCAILDIPVYDNPIESLHVMFTLYMDFKNNTYFQQQQGNQSAIADFK